MKPRNTLIVVALFAALFGYVWFIEVPKTSEQLATPTKPVPVVFQLKAQDVQSIELRDLRQPRVVKLARAGSGWQVEQPAAKPGDTPTIDDTLNQLSTLKATRVLTDTTLFAQYFVTPTLEARLVMSDTVAYAITVGDKTADGSNYYATYTGDKDKVFVVSGVTIDQLVTWLDEPPYEPTPMPTLTPTPPQTPTAETGAITTTVTPGVAPPGIVPTLVPATDTPKP